MSGLGCFANESGNGCQAVIQNMKDRTPRFLCLSPLSAELCSINDCQTFALNNRKTARGWGWGASGTDGRANPLFLKLGEFFP